LLGDPVINAIGRAAGPYPGAGHAALATSSAATIVFPKSVTRSASRRLRLFDFELTAEDVAAITAWTAASRTGPDPDTFQLDSWLLIRLIRLFRLIRLYI